MDQRYAASAIIYNSQGKVLLARRSQTKFPFPNVLSLPSTYVKDAKGNLVHEAVSDDEVRKQLAEAIKKKLGIKVIFKDVIGTMEGVQENYRLHMTDYFVKFLGGKITPNGTDFSEASFFDPVKELGKKDRSKIGFCTQVLLQKLDQDPKFWKKYF